MQKVEKLIIFTDGACRGNPGPSAIGGIIYDSNFNELEKFAAYIGEKTNNQAEYLAIVEALRRAKKYNPRAVEIRVDSELIAKQVNGIYGVKNDEIRKLYAEFKELSKEFEEITVKHIKREENKAADELCNRALDFAMQKKERIRGKFEVSVSQKFDCAHKLVNYEGKCANLHGHSYKVELAVQGIHLKEGILIDIVDLKKILKGVLNELDHRYLNEIDFFKDKSPTAENICLYLYENLTTKLPPTVKIAYIKVYESEDSVITYYPGG